MRDDVIRMIEQHRLIAILRGLDPETCLKVADSLCEGGIRLLEVTFDQTKDSYVTTGAIERIAKKYTGQMLIGAGTVMTVQQADQAADAGAEFLISPDVNVPVIQRTLERGVVSIPGAMTPTEIATAHRKGADFVKVFPADQMGPDYAKSVLGPLNNIRLLAVGGISKANVADYLRAGYIGAGIGGNLVKREWIAAGRYDLITQEARVFVESVSDISDVIDNNT